MAIIIGRVQNLTGGRFFVKDKDGNIKELNLNDSIYENDTVYGDSANSISSKIDILLSDTGVVVLNKGQKQLIDESLIKTAFGTEELFFTRESLEQTIDEHNLILDVDSDLRETKFKDDASIAEEDTKEGQEEKEDEEEGSGAFANRDGNIIDIESNLRKKAWAITRTFNEVEKSRELENIIKKELGKVPSNPFQPYQPTNQNSLNTVRPSTVKIEKSNRPESEGARPDDINQTNKDKLSTTPPSTLFVENPTNLSINDVTVYEQDGKLYFTVTLDKALKNDVTFTYKTNSGTATEGIDFIGKTGTITIPSGQTEVQISIDIIDDFIYENSEYFNIEITDIEGNIIPLKTQAIATILDNPPAFNEILGDSTDSQTGSYGAEDTVFAIITGDNSVKEGDTSSYKVELIDKDGNPVNVKQDTEVTVVYKNISTQDNDTEYKNEDKLKFIIKAGFSNVTFTVETIDDFYADNGEEFKLELEFVNTNEFENISLGDINQKNKDVTTEILDNTTTNPNNPSTVEATQENVILKLVACDDSGNPIMDGDKYTFTNSVAEGSSSKYMVLAFAPNTTSFTTSTVLDTQYQGGTVTISTTDGTAVTTGNIDNATLDFEKQSSTSVTVGQFFEIYSIDDYLADNNETFTVNIDTSSYAHPSTPIYENITIDSEKITTTIFDNSTDSPTQDSNIEPTQDSVIIKIVVANPDGTPKKDTNGNYLTQSDVTEGDSAYYVILAFKPDSNGVFNDSTKLADDKLFGSVEITTENIDAIGVSTQTFENGTQDYISFSNRVDLNTLITIKTLDDWKADNDEQFEVKIIDKSYDHPSSDIKYENITTDLNPVVTTIKDNTTTTPNIPSEIENSNNDNSAVEPVVLKIIALNQAGEIILKKDGAEDKFIANFDDLYNYENNIATLKEEYAGYSFADKNSVTEGSNSSYMVLAFAPNTTNFTTNTVLDTQYQGGTVTISTTDGTAVTTGNIDNATLDFEKQTSTSVTVGQSFSIKTIDDYLADNDETFTVNIDTSSYTHPNTDAIYENVTIDSSVVETTIKDNTTNTPNENSDVENTDNNNTSVDNVILKIVAVNSLGEPIDASGNKITDTTTSYVITSSVTEGDSAYYKVLAFKPDSNGVFNSSTKLADDKQVGSVVVETADKEAIGVTEQTLEDGTQDYISFADRVELNKLITVKTLDDWRADNDEQFEIKITDKSYNHPNNGTQYENVITDETPVTTTIKDNTTNTPNEDSDVENSNNGNTAVEPVVLKIIALNQAGKIILKKDGAEDKFIANFDDLYNYDENNIATLKEEYAGYSFADKNSVTEGSNSSYMVLAFAPNTTNFTTNTVLDTQYQGGTVTISTTDGTAKSNGTRFEATLDYEAKVIEATDGKTVTVGQAFQIKTLDDELADSEETFTVNIDNSSYIHPSTAIYENVTIKTESVTTTIYDNSTTMDGTSTNPNYPDTHNTEKDSSGNNDKEIVVLKLFARNVASDGTVTYTNKNHADELPGNCFPKYIVLAFKETEYNEIYKNKSFLTDDDLTAITSSLKQVGEVNIIFGQEGDNATGGNYKDSSGDTLPYPTYMPNSDNTGGGINPDYDATPQTVKVGEIFQTTVFKDYAVDLEEFYTVKIKDVSYKKDENNDSYESVVIKSDSVQTDIKERVFAKIEAVEIDNNGNIVFIDSTENGNPIEIPQVLTHQTAFEGSPLKYIITFVDEYGKTIALKESPTLTLEYKGLNTDNKNPATVKDHPIDENNKADFEPLGIYDEVKGDYKLTITDYEALNTQGYYILDIETIRDIHVEGSEWLEIELKNISYHGNDYSIKPHKNENFAGLEDLTKVQGEIKDNLSGNTNEYNTVYAIITGTQTIIEGETSTDYKVELLYKDGSPVNVTADTVVTIELKHGDTDDNDLNKIVFTDGSSTTISTNSGTQSFNITIKPNTSSTTFKIETKQDFWADNDEKFDLTITAIDGKVSEQATSKFEKVVFDDSYAGLSGVNTPSNKVTTTIIDDSKPKTGDILPNPNDPTDGKVETDAAQQVILRIVAVDKDGNLIMDGDKYTFVNDVTEGSNSKYMVLAFAPNTTEFKVEDKVNVQGGTVKIYTTDGIAKTTGNIDNAELDFEKETGTREVTVGTVFDIKTLDDYLADNNETFTVNIVNNSYLHPTTPIYENVLTNSGNVETTIKDNTTTTPNIPSEIENDNNGNSAVESVVLKIVALDESGKIIITKDSNTKYVSLEELKNYSDYSFVTNNNVKEGNPAKYMVLAFNPNTPAGVLTVKNALSQELQGGTVTIKTAEATDADKKATILDEQIAGDGNKDYQAYSNKLVTLGVAFEVETFDDWRADDDEKFNVEINNNSYNHPSAGAIYENVTTDENKVTTTIKDNTTSTPNAVSSTETNGMEQVILKIVIANSSGEPQLDTDGITYKTTSDVNEGDSAYYIVLAFKPNTTDFTTDNLLSIQDGTVQVSTKNITGGATGVGNETKIDGTEDYISKSEEIKVGGGTENVFEVVTIDDYKVDADEKFEVTILDGSGNGTYKHPSSGAVYENVTSEGNVTTTIKDNPATVGSEVVTGNPIDGSSYGEEDTVYVVITAETKTVNEGEDLVYYLQILDKDGNKVEIPSGEKITVNLVYTSTTGTVETADFKTDKWTQEVEIDGTGYDAGKGYKFTNTTIIDAKVEGSESYKVEIGTITQANNSFENIVSGYSESYKTANSILGDGKSETGTIKDNDVRIVLVAVDNAIHTTVAELPKDVNGALIIDATNTASEGGTLYYMAVAVDANGVPLNVQAGSVTVTYGQTPDNGTRDDYTIQAGKENTVNIGERFEVKAKDDFYAEGNENFIVTISEPNDTAKSTYGDTVNVDTSKNEVTSTITDNAPTTGAAVVTGNLIDGSFYGEEDTVYVVIKTEKDTVKEGDELVYYLQILDKDGNKVEIPSDEKITVNLVYESKTGVVDASDFETGIWTQKVDIESTTTYVEDKGYKFTNKTIVDNKVEKIENYTVTIGTISQEKHSFENIVSGYSDTYKTTHSDTLNGKDGKSATGAIHDNPVKIVLVAVTKDDINEDGTVKLENIDLSKTTNTAPEGGKLYYVAVAVDSVSNKPLLTQTGSVKVAYTTEDIIGNKAILENATNSDPKYPTDIKIYEATKVDLGKVFIVDALDDYYADADEKFEVIISNPDNIAKEKYETVALDGNSVEVVLGNTTVTSIITDNKPEINQSDSNTGEDNSSSGNYGTEDTVYAVITGETIVNEGGETKYTVKLVDKAGNIVIPTKETIVTVTYKNVTTSDADTNKNDNDTIEVTLDSSLGLGTFTVKTTDDYYAEEPNESYKVEITDVTNTGEFENVKFDNYEKTSISNPSNNVITTIVDNPAAKNQTVTTDSNPIDGIDDDNKTIYGEEDTVWAVITQDTENGEVTEGGKVTYTVKLVESDGETAVNVSKNTTVKIKFTGVDNPADLDDILKVFNGDANSTEENSNGFEIINNGTEDEYILTITIPANSDKTQFTIQTKPDIYTENPESFDLTINDIDSTEFENLVFVRLKDGGDNKTTTTTQDRDTADKDEDNTVYAIITGNTIVYEGGETTYTVKLVDKNGNAVKVEAGTTVTVTYTNIGTTSTDDTDKTHNEQIFVSIGSDGKGTFTVKTKDDYYAEGDENYKVQITKVDDTQKQFEKVEWINYANTSISNPSNSVTTTIKDNDAKYNQDISEEAVDTNTNTYGEEDTIWAVIEAVDESGNVIENPKPTEGESITYRIKLINSDGQGVTVSQDTTVTVKFAGENANVNLEDLKNILVDEIDVLESAKDNAGKFTIIIPANSDKTQFTIETKVDVLNEMTGDDPDKVGEKFDLTIDSIASSEFENLVYSKLKDGGNNKVTTEIKDTTEPTQENTVYAIITGTDEVAEGSNSTYTVKLIDYLGNEVKVTQATKVTLLYSNTIYGDLGANIVDDIKSFTDASRDGDKITVIIPVGSSEKTFTIETKQDFWADNNEKFDLTITGVGSCFACGAQSEEFEKVIFSDYSAGGYEGKDVDGLRKADLTNTVTTTIIDNSNKDSEDKYPDPNEAGEEETTTQAVILKIVALDKDGKVLFTDGSSIGISELLDADGNIIYSGNKTFKFVNEVAEGSDAHYMVLAFDPQSGTNFTTNNLVSKQAGTVWVETQIVGSTVGVESKGSYADDGTEDYISKKVEVELGKTVTVSTIDDWKADNNEQFKLVFSTTTADKGYSHPTDGGTVKPLYENVVTDLNPVTTTIKDNTTDKPNADSSTETNGMEQVILKIVAVDKDGNPIDANGDKIEDGSNYVTTSSVAEGDKAYYKVFAFKPGSTDFNDSTKLSVQAGTVTVSTADVSGAIGVATQDEFNGTQDYTSQSTIPVTVGDTIFTVQTLDDYKAEEDETFKVNIDTNSYKHPSDNVANAVYENVLINTAPVTTTIIDNDATYNNSASNNGVDTDKNTYGEEDTVWVKIIPSGTNEAVEGKSIEYIVKFVDKAGNTVEPINATKVTIKFAGTDSNGAELVDIKDIIWSENNVKPTGGSDTFEITIPTTGSTTFTVTTLDDFTSEGDEQFTLTITDVERKGEFENLVWNDDTKNNSVTTTIKDGVTLGTPENATVYEHSLYKDIEDKPKTDSQSLDITNPNNDDYDVFFDTEFDNFTYTHVETQYPFKSNGSKLDYTYSEDGKTLTATSKGDGTKVFTITLNEDKKTYTFELHQPMDHIIEHVNDTSFDIPFKFYVESDGTKSDSKEVKVTVVDSIPVATDIVETINEEENITIRLSNEAFGNNGSILINGHQIDKDGIADIYDNGQTTSNPIGTLTNHGDGTVTFKANANYSNYDTNNSPKFSYTLTDFDGDTATGTVKINVNPVANKPEFEKTDYTVTTTEDDENTKEGTNATKLNLKLPVITDTTDQNNGGVGDSPERLGAIEFNFNTSSDFGTAQFGYMDGESFVKLQDIKKDYTFNIFISDKTGYHVTGTTGTHTLTQTQYENIAIIHEEDNATNIKTTISVKSYEVDDDGKALAGVDASDEVSQTITLDVIAVTDSIELKWDHQGDALSMTNDTIQFNTVDEGTTATINLNTYLSKTSGAGSDATLDLDGSEKRTYTIEGVPHGTIVTLDGKIATAGTDGKITIPFPDNKKEDPEFSIKFPDTYSGTVKGKITLSVQDTDSDSPSASPDKLIKSVFFTISINPVANPVTINVAQAVGDEDQARDDEGNIPDLTTAQKGINLNINVYSDDNTDIEGTGTEEDDFGSTLDEKETYNVTIGDIPNGSSILVWDNALEKEVLVTFIDDSTPPTKQVWDTDSKSWVEYTDSNITTPTESGKYVLKIEDYQNDKQPKLITPFDSDVDFTLQISARSVDGGSINYSSNLPLKITLNATVDIVAGEFNFETVNGTNYQVVVNEDNRNTNNGAEISLSDIYNTKPTTNDTDGSESLSYVITDLGADFGLIGATLLKGEGENRFWVVSKDQFENVKITTKQHFSGEIGFKIGYISTEEAGASNTQTDVANLTDAKILVKPVAEAILTGSMAINEDELKKLEFSLDKNGDINEEFISITIYKSTIESDFKLYYKDGTTYIDLNTITDIAGKVTVDENKITFTASASQNIYAQFKDDLGTPTTEGTTNTFNFDYVIKDPLSIGSDDLSNTDTKSAVYTLNLYPITDNISIDVAGVDKIVGANISVAEGNMDATNTYHKEEVTINSTGSFTVTVDISALGDSETDTTKDTDGSEKITRLVIEGVPEGISIEGGTYAKAGDGTNLWFVTVDKNFTTVNSGKIEETLTFKVNDQLKAGTGDSYNIKITAYNQDGSAEVVEKSTEIVFIDNMDNSGENGTVETIVSSIEKRDYQAIEDTEFTLNDIVKINPNSNTNVTGVAYSITFKDTDLKNLIITDDSALNVYEKGGVIYYALSIPAGSDIETELAKVKFKPFENLNENNNSVGVEIKDISMTAYVPNTSNIIPAESKTTYEDKKVTPVTDKPTLSITEDTINEDNIENKTFNIVIDTVDNPNYSLDGDVTITHVAGSVLGKFVLADNSEKVFTDGSSITLTKAQLEGIKFIPTANVSGEAKFTASATTQETGASTTETGTGNITITVIPVVDSIENFTNLTASGKEDTKGKGTTLGDNKYTEIKANGDSLSSLNLSDTDGSEEITQITLKGLPDGFTVHYGNDKKMATNGGKDGTTILDGKEVAINTWSIPAVGGKLPNIYIKAPEHWSGTVADLTLSTVVKDGTVEQTFVENFSVSIEAVASDITITPTDAIGKEYAWNKINLNANATDIDGSETTIITLKAKSGSNDLDDTARFKLSDGTILDGQDGRPNATFDYYNKTWTLEGVNTLDLPNLQIMYHNYDGKIDVTAKTVDGADTLDTAVTGKFVLKTSTSSIIDLSAENNDINFDIFVNSETLQVIGRDKQYGEDNLILGDIDFSKLADKITNIDTLDLGKDGDIKNINQDISLTLEDVLDMTDSDNKLIIKGDSDDKLSLMIEEGWILDNSNSEENTFVYSKDDNITVTIKVEDITLII